MKYEKIVFGKFIARPNRFIAYVEVDGVTETVHVKNTGRCKELLIPGCRVVLAVSDNPARKTKYDLICTYKQQGFDSWINLDSQAPNKVTLEWLQEQDYTYIKPEYTYGDSRIDFYMEKEQEKFLMEVKGCTLEREGVGYFPDAPTERGIKHLHELTKAAALGYHCILSFVIQMEGIHEVRPNMETHPEFGQALQEAKEAGVEIWFLCCHVEPDVLQIKERIKG